MSAIYNFTDDNALCQGGTWSWSIVMTNSLTGAPYNITGYTARMHLREYVGATTTLLELTTENGRLTISGSAGIISASVLASVTALLNFDRASYDLEIVSGAVVMPVIRGVVDLVKEVTR
jgi:hypothetical protein